MTKRVGPITLDGEAADRITLLNLKEFRNHLKRELSDWKKIPILTAIGCILKMWSTISLSSMH
jgi:hypothetical protein